MKSVTAWLTPAAAGLILLSVTVAASGSPAVASGRAGHGVVHVVHVAGGKVNTNTSNNWSGYNIGARYPGEPTGVMFTSITGEWTVPAARQHVKGQAEYSASWAGIGGGCVTDNCSVTDNTLIQAGTRCTSMAPRSTAPHPRTRPSTRCNW